MGSKSKVVNPQKVICPIPLASTLKVVAVKAAPDFDIMHLSIWQPPKSKFAETVGKFSVNKDKWRCAPLGVSSACVHMGHPTASAMQRKTRPFLSSQHKVGAKGSKTCETSAENSRPSFSTLCGCNVLLLTYRRFVRHVRQIKFSK